MIFETHAHYDDEQFDTDRERLLESMPEQGIERIVNVGSSLSSTEKSIELAKRYPQVYAAVGVHPSETAELNEETYAWLGQQAKEEKVVAIGEIGLDYYWPEPDRSLQQYWFERQIELARNAGLPMIIHSRDAAKDTFERLKASKAEEIGGVIHCFSYGLELAKVSLDMGFYLGIGGVLTFNNAKKLKEVVKYAPIESLLLETDCPYLAPVPYRGKRNSSLYLFYVVKEIAAVKGISEEEVIDITNQNARTMYHLEKARV